MLIRLMANHVLFGGVFYGNWLYTQRRNEMTAKEIAQEAIGMLNKNITNEVFLTIQNNRPLILKYFFIHCNQLIYQCF